MGYITTSEFLLMTNAQSSEWPASNLQYLIDQASKQIDVVTGRTWAGTQTSSSQYVDGTGTNQLKLPVSDLASVTVLKIDDNNDGTFTAITVSSNSSDGEVMWYSHGLVQLNANATITTFPLYPKSVFISYTYGNSTPDDMVKRLCCLMVMQMIKHSDTRNEEIQFIFNHLSTNVPF